MDLTGRPCLVVGAGAVAARKARALLECGARVTVVGIRPAAACRALERRGVAVRDRRFRTSDVTRQALIIAATDDPAVNAAVAAAARSRRIPVNAVDDPANCSFIVPAVVTRGDLTVAISTGGKSPAVARLVKARIAAVLGDEYAALVRLLGAHRERMKDTVATQPTRARAWKRMLDAGLLESLRKGDRAGAEKTVRGCLAAAAGDAPKPNATTASALAGRRGRGSGGAKQGTPTARSPERAPTGVRRDGTPQPARERRAAKTEASRR
jgi:siroheme synthase-like protein